MKYYCKNCGSTLIEGYDTRRSDNYEVYCPMCEDENGREVTMQPVSDYETPQQYEKRTGKAWPDDGLVFILTLIARDRLAWEHCTYEIAKYVWDPIPTVIADPPVPPPDDWRLK
jgi:hypothetical protein